MGGGREVGLLGGNDGESVGSGERGLNEDKDSPALPRLLYRCRRRHTRSLPKMMGVVSEPSW
jgi:hypothetical protein